MTTPDDYFESAMMYLKRGDAPSSIRLFEKAILSRPKGQEISNAACYNNRGNLLKMLGNAFDAVLNYEEAIRLAPAHAEYHQNKGAALADDLGELKLAEQSYLKALDLNPNLDQALVNLANVYKITARIPQAIDLYRKAISITPEFVDGHLNLSFALLDSGQFEEGWREYEWRWKSNQLPPRGLPFPNWEGEAIAADKAVLVYAEQGFGDALQFMRYASMVKERCGGRVYVEVRSPLVRVTRTLDGIDGVVAFGEKPPADVAYIVAMMSLPRIFGTNIDTVPSRVPYLCADQHRAESWRTKMAALPPGIRVGICWAGMARQGNAGCMNIDARRSMRLADFAPLAMVPNVSWVSLQLGPPSEQVRVPPTGMTIGDWTSEIDDFWDSAALISCLDLVIAVDTAVVHLAGALGKPVWMISRYDSCWRWLQGQKTSPWYPSMRVYRQQMPGEWAQPLAEMRKDLIELTKLPAQRVAA